MFRDLVPTILKAFAAVATAGVVLGGAGYYVGKEVGKKEAVEASQKTAPSAGSACPKP